MFGKKKKQPDVQRFWYTPTETILSEPTEKKQTIIFNGEDIAKFLTGCGCACSLVKVVSAPQLVAYHFKLDNVMDITKLKKPISALSASVHTNVTQTSSDIGHFALVIPRKERWFVSLRECMMTDDFHNFNKSIPAVVGADINCKALPLSIGDMPHILIAGATGSGKSVLLNSIICSTLFKKSPSELQFIMIDPKKVELSKYEGLPHLCCPIVKDHNTAVETLKSVCDTMDETYRRMSVAGAKKASDMGLPSLVVVIDELADLMLTSKYECEQSIIRIAQLGRAAGIHLIIATQRPTVNVITGLIKSNIPCKIALQTSSIRDSITILDHKGAESLTGKGDALLKLPDRVEEIRFQSAYINDTDIERVVEYWKHNALK